MARRVHMHIGLPKTGTTFIQTTMWENRAALRRQGFLYPGSSRMDHYHASKEVRGTPARRMGGQAGVWRRIVDELAAWEGDGLVSHEFLSMATPEQAAATVQELAPAEVHVVVTIRSYILQFAAVWQESLKMNSHLSFDEFMGRLLGDLPSGERQKGAWSWESQDIVAVLERWSTAVPPSRLTVVTVPPPGAPRGLLWERWREAIGIDDSELDLDVHYANESLGAAQAALLMRVKSHLSDALTEGSVRHRWVRKYFGHEVLVPQRGARFGPRPPHVEKLRALSGTAAQAIREGGYPVIGDLDDLVSVEAPTGAPPDDISETEMLDVATRAIEQMIRDVRKVTIERDLLRATIRKQPERGPRALARRAVARAKRGLRR